MRVLQLLGDLRTSFKDNMRHIDIAEVRTSYKIFLPKKIAIRPATN